MIGPFVEYEKNPILKPGSGFYSKAAYNPAVIKENNQYNMFFRGESYESSLTGVIGIAKSSDGFNFEIVMEPVIVPDNEYDKFGCEDPRIVKIKEIYYLTYVGNPGKYGRGNICLATSKDLTTWQKHGSILIPTNDWDKGQVKAGAVIPEPINGKYYMYFMGEKEPWKTAIGLAESEDLLKWNESLKEPVALPRSGFFDSKGIEPGPTPVITSEGIWLIYSGWGDNNIYQIGAILFDRENPSRIIERSEKPIVTPSRNWGEYYGGIPGHLVPEGLIVENDRWLLYYGVADRSCCISIWEVEK